MAVCILTLTSAVRQKDETPSRTIKRRAELVLVQAAVMEDGRAVRGLDLKDFTLLHNGQQVQVAEFDVIDAVPAKAEPPALPPRTVQNYDQADRRQDVPIILIDFLNADRLTETLIRRHFSAMVQELDATHTPASVFVLSYRGLVRAHSYSSDPENLRKAFEQWGSLNPKTEGKKISNTFPDWASPISATDGTYTIFVLRQFAVLPENAPRNPDYVPTENLNKRVMTLRAIEQLAEAFRGIPGRKKLIWISKDGPGYLTRPLHKETDDPIIARAARAWKSLSDANTAVFPIFARPSTVRAGGLINETLQRSSANNAEDNMCWSPGPMWTSIEIIKKERGNSCDDWPEKCLQRMLADTHYYLLGFYLHGNNKPGWHTLQVKVNRLNTTVHARDGFLVYEDAAPANLEKTAKDVLAKASPNDDAVAVALSSPLDYTSIPLRLHWTALNTPGKETQVELAVSSPPGGIAVNADDMSLNIDFLAFFKPVGAKEGQPFPSSLSTVLNPEQQKTFATSGFRFRRQVTLAPGRYEVRVLLRDNVARKMGTVSTIIDLSQPPAAKPDEHRR